VPVLGNSGMWLIRIEQIGMHPSGVGGTKPAGNSSVSHPVAGPEDEPAEAEALSSNVGRQEFGREESLGASVLCSREVSCGALVDTGTSLIGVPARRWDTFFGTLTRNRPDCQLKVDKSARLCCRRRSPRIGQN
jgi:hypothetical protein